MLNVRCLITILILLSLGTFAHGQELTPEFRYALDVLSFKNRLDSVSRVPFAVHVITTTSNHCTGVVVKKGYVLTASHCFSTMESSGVVVFAGGRTERFSVVYKTLVGSVADFAILKTNTGAAAPASLSTTTPNEKAIVSHAGYPLGYRDQFTTHGIIVKRDPVIWIASLSVPGESGSPVFDGQGRVFAIIQSSYSPASFTQAIPIGPALKALSEVEGR